MLHSEDGKITMEGRFAYCLHGFMQAQNPLPNLPGSYKYIDVSGINNNPVGTTGGSLNVNLAGATLIPDPKLRVQLHPLLELPQLTGLRPTGIPQPPQFNETGVDTGFYPFSEIGYIDFDGSGSLGGWARGNNAGYPIHDQNLEFKGAYELDPNGVTGIFSVQLQDLHNHVWDYVFANVSKDEFLLSVAGRLPRPAVGTGSLRRME